ncbi:MAG TPA: hypothetical protein VHU15_08160 [Stellaceae bacterium]|jgi:hypothetical protein|nr:hypothetical protein [Stellaceae bacterium]
MLSLIRRIGLGRLGAVLVAVLCLGTMTTFSKPAEARIWVGVNFGYPGYYYAPSYYYPAYYPYYGYYRPYWRHHYRHARYWHHRHWCRWHRCYW